MEKKIVMKHKLIAALTTKDEEWIVGKTLEALSGFCDIIVVLDDNSDDNTEKICRSFKKVDFHKRLPRTNPWERLEAEGLNELFNLAGAHNPDYILMLDADEIPTPSFLKFFNNIDTSIEGWSVTMVNLQPDEGHYRIDAFMTPSGCSVNHNPFCANNWRKTVLVKYDPTKPLYI